MRTPPPSPRPPAELLDLTGRRAVVTGAARGIGTAIATRLAEAGAAVVVNHRSGDGDALAERLRADGHQAVAVRADVAEPDGAATLIGEALDALGGLDVLVNNAAAQPVAPLADITAEEWDSVAGGNLRSTFRCVQEAASAMGEGGAIVNIASIEAFQAQPGHAHYGASKAGVVRLTQSAALELGGKGIRVNAIAPGLIWREGLDRDWPEGVERWERAAPLGRVGHPDDVADAVVFLASDAARWITGTTLTVDGGVTAAPSW